MAKQHLNPRMVRPVFGEAYRHHRTGMIFARIRTKAGKTYVHTNGKIGFRSMIAALDVAHHAVREGVPLSQLVRVS